MSGKYGGVQKKIQETLNKRIPYVHCFNHQLHMVVVHTLKAIDDVKRFFHNCSSLYDFIRRPKLSSIYTGAKLKRLMEQRWSGHLEATSAILTNYHNIIDVLDTCKCESNRIKADVIIEATGLLKLLQNRKFFVIAVTMGKVLMLLFRADKALQSRTCDVTNAFSLVETTIYLLKGMRRDIDGTFKQISAAVENALEENEESNEVLTRGSGICPQPLMTVLFILQLVMQMLHQVLLPISSLFAFCRLKYLFTLSEK